MHFNMVSSCRRLDLTARDLQGDQLPSNLSLLVQATNVNSVESNSIFDSTQLTYTHSRFAVCIRLSLLADAGRTALNTRHGYHIKTYSQQVSYVCCTVCYAHSFADSPGCGLRRRRICFYIANSLRAGFEPALSTFRHQRLPIPSPRVPGVNYSPVWLLPADNINHIETHSTKSHSTTVYKGRMCFYMVGAQRIEL
jgi:hypothetical protein